MAAGTIFGIICALAILAITPPVYKATSRIVFEKTLPRYFQTNKVSNEPVIDEYDTLGQAYVISAESVLLQVVRSLSLANDPEFVGRLERKQADETITSRIRKALRSIKDTLGLPKEWSEPHSHDLEKVALDTLTRNLTVSREDVASVFTIAYTSKDPVKAAAIVNAIVETYTDQGMVEKKKSTAIARNVVQERVEELKQQVADADRALLDYKAANSLVGTDQLTLSHGQLNVLQTQLTNAQLSMADAKARIERIAGDPEAISQLVPDNEVIKKLRGELLDLSTRANDIEKVVGKKHAAAVKLRDRMKEISQAIAGEQQRIAESFKNEYDLAKTRYDELSTAVSQVISSEGVHSNAQARLRELESSVETLRNLYSRMLQQVSEMSTADAQPSIRPDARILSRAIPPLQTESSKIRMLILASGSLMGLLLGSAILLAKNFPFGVFRTSQQVTNATGLSCVILPEVLGNAKRASLKTGEYVLKWPYSRFAQAMRSIWAMISIAHNDRSPQVVGVISSNPGEGKTTVAINLAAHFGQHTATRVLLIDADFYRQSLTKSVAPESRTGLKEALAEPEALAKFVVRKDNLNIDILPCPTPNGVMNPTELLGTAEMDQLIQVARANYDLVIIESPPMAAIVDYKMIARHCSDFVLVVEWGKTSQRLVLECLSDASALLDKVLCVVLNKAESSALRSIERYKGDEFQSYYSDRKGA